MAENSPEVVKTNEPFELWAFPSINDHVIHHKVDENTEKPEEADETHEAPNPEKESLILQLELLTKINQELAQSVKQIDETLLTQIITCIKKVTHKIILSELKQNDDALAAMIENTLETLKTQSPCTILISPDDFQRLQNLKSDGTITAIQPEPSLSEGDYKIITPTGSISAILTERIETLFGLTK